MIDDEESGDDWTPFAALIGDRAVMPVFGFQVVSFLDENGTPQLDWLRRGDDVTGASAMGTIMGAAFEMFHDHLHHHRDGADADADD